MIVAGTTAFLARAWLQAERAAIAAQIAESQAGGRALGAGAGGENALRTGQLIKPEDLRWQAWPQGALPQTYIIEGKRPLTDFVGAVARTSFVSASRWSTPASCMREGSRGFARRACCGPACAPSACRRQQAT